VVKIDIGNFTGGAALDINDSGAVVGYMVEPQFFVHFAFLWTATGGTIRLDSTPAEARAINNAGQVVGVVAAYSGDRLLRHAFWWTAESGMLDLGPPALGSPEGVFATDINEAGQVVGGVTDAGISSGVVWMQTGVAIHLGNQGQHSYLTAINSAGEIAGYRSPLAGTAQQGVAVLWQPVDELVLDFGTAHGVWAATDSGWSPVHQLSPSAMVRADLDNNGSDDLVLDFGPDVGVWAWMNHASWQFVHPASPSLMMAADLDGNGNNELIAVFPGAGIWRLATGSWAQLVDTSPARLAVGQLDGAFGDDLILDFPGQGLYALLNPYDQWNAWQWLHGQATSSMVMADLDASGQDELVVDFPGSGLWVLRNYSAWTALHPLSALHLAAGRVDANYPPDLVVDFGAPHGLWTFRNDTAWVPLHARSAESLFLVDRDASGRDEIIVDFGPADGVWQYGNDSVWTVVHSQSTEGIVSARFP
jgi:probable HAF family extracellular repeat protein